MMLKICFISLEKKFAHKTKLYLLLTIFSDGLCMTKPESIAVVIEFLTLVCSEGRMRDWLGKEGSDFWLPLLSLLSNRPIEGPSASSSRYVDLHVH